MDDYEEILLTVLQYILIQKLINHMHLVLIKEELSYCCTLLKGEEDTERDLATLVISLNYKGVIQHLTRNQQQANDGLDMVIANITGLEDGVLREDWKMVAIFYLFGAHPKYNCFSGTLDGVFREETENLIIRCFRVNDPIPGYIGLRNLLEENDSYRHGDAYLSILEILQESDDFVICRDFGSILSHLDLVQIDLLYNARDCKKYIKTM